MPGKRRLVRMSGAPGQPRSAASEPSHAPLTRHLSPGLRFVCAFFSPSSRARHRAPGRLLPLPRPPPPFPGRITFPGLRSGSRGCLQRPRSRRSIAELPEPEGGVLGARGGGEGRGRARTFDPGGPAAGWGWGPGGAAQEGGGGWGEKGPEQPRSGERASEGARRGSEGAASQRERERCSDRDCHWGQRSTAPGSRAAEAPLRARSPAGPRAPARPSCSPGPLEPPPASRGPGVARGGGS